MNYSLLPYNARKELYIFLGISQGEKRFLTSLGSDTIPSDTDDMDTDNVFPSAGLFGSMSQGTGQPRE